MLTTLITLVVADGTISSVFNIMYHNELNYTKRQQFVCSEFALTDAIV
jgi:hypothetical protein